MMRSLCRFSKSPILLCFWCVRVGGRPLPAIRLPWCFEVFLNVPTDSVAVSYVVAVTEWVGFLCWLYDYQAVLLCFCTPPMNSIDICYVFAVPEWVGDALPAIWLRGCVVVFLYCVERFSSYLVCFQSVRMGGTPLPAIRLDCIAMFLRCSDRFSSYLFCFCLLWLFVVF